MNYSIKNTSPGKFRCEDSWWCSKEVLRIIAEIHSFVWNQGPLTLSVSQFKVCSRRFYRPDTTELPDVPIKKEQELCQSVLNSTVSVQRRSDPAQVTDFWPLTDSPEVHVLTPGLLYYFILFLMEEMFTAVLSVVWSLKKLLKNLDPVCTATELRPCMYGSRTYTWDRAGAAVVKHLSGMNRTSECAELCSGHCWAQRQTRNQQLFLNWQSCSVTNRPDGSEGDGRREL